MKMRTAGLIWDVTLVDDGSMDAVIEVQPIRHKQDGGQVFKAQTVRFNPDFRVRAVNGRVFASNFRQLAKQAIEAYDADTLPTDFAQ